LPAPPSFDCRASSCYPVVEHIRHYFSWRQVDTDNNLYNTTFWALVLKGGLKMQEAADELQVCLSYIFHILDLIFRFFLVCREGGRTATNYQVGTG